MAKHKHSYEPPHHEGAKHMHKDEHHAQGMKGGEKLCKEGYKGAAHHEHEYRKHK